MGFGMLWFGREQGVGLAEKRRGRCGVLQWRTRQVKGGDMFDFEV